VTRTGGVAATWVLTGKPAAYPWLPSPSIAGPLHVLHVYKDVFSPVIGGIERHIDGLRRSMPEVRSDVLVCSHSSRTDERWVAGGRELRVRELGPRPLAVPVAPEVLREVRRSDADLVHVHMPYPLGELAALVGARGRPVVCSFHADVVRQARWLRLYRPLVQRILDRADAIVVGSERIARTSPLFGPPRPIDAIPYGVDLDWFDPAQVSADERAGVRARYGGGRRPIVLAVGRLVYYKGLGHLVAAAGGLDAEVVIVGHGPLAFELRAQAQAQENVHVTGRLDEQELRGHLAAADLFVLASSSRAESFGVATVEAQVMGLPAVVGEVGTGTTDAIAPGQTGIAVPPRDPAALHAALVELVAAPERRRAMGAAARERGLERFDVRARARDVEAVYRRVVTGR
jgi:glycosyltransferase involved in cell wall biosynthesis